MRAYTATFGREGVDAAAELWDPEIEWRALETDEARAIRGVAHEYATSDEAVRAAQTLGDNVRRSGV